MAKAYASTVLEASADDVWAVVRAFDSLSSWNHELVPACEIEDGRGPDQVGAVRRFALADGTPFRERLVALSDLERSFSYEALEAPFDVDRYVATMRVSPVTDGDRSFVAWWATFECDRDRVERTESFFAAKVFGPALAQLRAHVARAR